MRTKIKKPPTPLTEQDKDIMNAFGVLVEVAENSGRRAKEYLMEDFHASDTLREIFRLTYNWLLPFHITPRAEWLGLCPLVGRSTATKRWNKFVELAMALHNREYTGHEALRQCEYFFKRVPRREGMWFIRILAKDLKIGASVKTAAKIWPDIFPKWGVQKALTYKKAKAIDYPVLTDIKINGRRVLIVIKDSNPLVFSITGRELPNLRFIAEYLTESGVKNTVIDCEAYAGSWNKTSSLISKKTLTPAEWKDMKESMVFWCFDALPLKHFNEGFCPLTLKQRRGVLEKIIPRAFSHNPQALTNLRLMPYEIAHNDEELMALYEQYSDTHEGMMIKKLNGVWQAARTEDWLKLKPHDTFEGVIVGRYHGRAGTKHEHRLGGFIVEVNGVQERVGGGFSDLQREMYWKKGKQMQGQVLEFKRETSKGIESKSQFARFERMRDLDDVTLFDKEEVAESLKGS